MLRLVDVAIIAVYLIAMVAIGIACRGRQSDENDYFTGGGGFSQVFGAILVGLSIAATFFSGISFLSYPSEVYKTGVTIVAGIVILPLGGLIVAYWFLPRYLKFGVREPYEIVERRFGYPTRAVAAMMFVLLRITWMGTLIYAPTVAVMAAAQLPESYFWPIVLTIGLTSTFYTTLGGIRGVIVTDAIQFLVIAIGLVWPVAYVASHFPAPLSEAWSYLGDSDRLQWIKLSTDFREPYTIGSLVFGFMTANLAIYIADQMSLQRYLASEDLQAARRAFAINIAGVMIVIVLLALVGLSMAIWYGLATSRIPPEKADHVFPFFVASELPAGGPGLILAAILAATMSSMTSGINSLAGTLTLDLASRSGRLTTSAQRLAFGRWASVAIGVLATGVAGLVGKLGSIFEIAQATTGVFLGPLLACVVLSVTRIAVRPWSMVVGMIAGSVVGWIVVASNVYVLWVAPAAAAISFAAPLLVSSFDYVAGRNRIDDATLASPDET
ncbi:MAG: hypothetical protein WBC44_15505 [Planctomycetaceae bacterium]